MNEELVKTVALMQQHQAMLLFTLAELPEVEKAVAEGRLGNAQTTRDKIRLHREAIKQLATNL